jgi:UrcA family protein
MNAYATRFVGLSAACLLAALTTHGAGAAAVNTTPSLMVQYDARSLATEDGARTLYRRIESAARQVCPDDSSVDLMARPAVLECREQAVSRAVHQINNSRLLNVYERHDQ